MTESAKSMSDEFRELARSLREGAGREMREEAAADEELSERQRRRRLDMAGAARAALHRGDGITIRVGGLTLTQPVQAVGNDYLTMSDADRDIDVLLAAAVVTVTPVRAGGGSGRPASRTFRARLAELEQDGREVEVVTADGLRVMGRLEVAASDHVAVVDGSGTRTYVPAARVFLVFSRRPLPRD